MISQRKKARYENVKVRADSAAEEISKLKENQKYDKSILEDSKGMLCYCYEALYPEVLDFTNSAEVYHELMLGDLTRLIRNSRESEVYKRRREDIKISRLTLEKILKVQGSSKEEITILFYFFKNISRRCDEVLRKYNS